MAVVYKAWHTRLCRPVALKMIRGGAQARPGDAARFRQARIRASWTASSASSRFPRIRRASRRHRCLAESHCQSAGSGLMGGDEDVAPSTKGT